MPGMATPGSCGGLLANAKDGNARTCGSLLADARDGNVPSCEPEGFWPASVLVQPDLTALLLAIPCAQFVADMRDALAAERVAFFVEHIGFEQFGEALCGRQHRIPCVQRGQWPWQ